MWGQKKWNAWKDFTLNNLRFQSSLGCKGNLGTWPGLTISLCHKTRGLFDAVWASTPPTPDKVNSRHSTKHKVSKERHVSIITTDHKLSKRNIEEFQQRALHLDSRQAVFSLHTYEIRGRCAKQSRTTPSGSWNTRLSIKRISVWNVAY